MPSPMAVMFAQWKEQSGWLNRPEVTSLPEAEFDALVDARIDLENRMMAEPPQDATDALMMIAAYSEFGAGDVPCRANLPKLWDQVRAALGEGGAA
ncbi:hypothetical protein [Paracoccus rhizosphaerae]|uniref:Uncharacterized protein n=1 Tax=Paracoccus rhizosphaerae TaxID=1133347 RepID=A0ABV6CKZ0_9RHOB|nr:hypothetical protein [Paracoccus rhizosphaerae]